MAFVRPNLKTDICHKCRKIIPMSRLNIIDDCGKITFICKKCDGGK